MKYFVLIILFFAALSFAQVGKYTHIVAGNFNKAGQHLAQGFACWDTKNNRFGNLPRATFGGGQVSDIATAGKGFLVVGDFTSVNGIQANGIAFFDGSKWTAFPHLNLYTYDVPNPAAVTNPIQFPNRRNQRAGYAVAIAKLAGNANDFYVFGGLRGNLGGRPAFNQVGTVQTGVAGLVRLTFDGTANFTVNAVGGYETRPGRFSTPLNDGNGYPADSAPVGTIGSTKVRVVSINNILNFFVHPAVGQAGDIQRWRTGTGSVDSQWIAVTQSTIVQQNFNVSQVSTAYNILAQGLNSVARDFDHDGTNLFVVGQFDNSANTTGNVNYVNVACSPNAHTNGITWQTAATWANINNFNQTSTQVAGVTNANLGAFRIATESTGVFYVASAFVSVDVTTGADRDLAFVPQYFIYKVSNNLPTRLGFSDAVTTPRFDLPPTGGAPQFPTFNRLSVYNGRLYVFGNFAFYSWVNNQNNQWPRHYARCISNAVLYDGNDFIDAYGGFTTVGAAYPLVAPNAEPGVDFVYVAGQTNFYDIFSAGSVVAYNKDTKRWVNLAANRFTLRGTGAGSQTIQGTNGNVGAVHFIRRQRDNVNDAVVVAGEFDWYGNQYLASVAYLRTSNGQYEQLGGGLFVEENSATYEADQTLPLYRAARVFDIEEIDGRFYAGGVFTKNTQGVSLNNLASVSATNTGDVWAPLGPGCDGLVRDLIAKGEDLYVGGDFDSCAGVDGTRRVARYNTKKGTWWALQEGLEGSVYAMIFYRGNLLVGGTFAGRPAAYRSGNNGLWEWDGTRWAPLSTRCLKDCDGVTNFNFPFAGNFDPASRSVNDVRSLRTTGGNLYIHGSVPGGAANVLIQYDGSTFKQYGTANNGCAKQGCLASNFSEVIALFNRPNGLNQNYVQYNPDRQNWVDTYTGFDNQPVIVASATQVALSLFSLFLVIVLAF